MVNDVAKTQGFQQYVQKNFGALEAKINQLQQAIGGSFQRGTWVKLGGRLFNLAHVADIELTESGKVNLYNHEVDTAPIAVLDPSVNAHVQKLKEQVGEQSVIDAGKVVFGWLHRAILDSGTAVLDCDQNLNKLEISGQEPVKTEAPVEQVAQENAA